MGHDFTLDMVATIPAEVTFDAEHREWTASNDDIRVAAAGRTREEALSAFRLAAAVLILEEVGNAYEALPRYRELVPA